MKRIFSSLRVRLLMLVLVAVIPALGLTLYSGIEQKRQEVAHVEMEALRFALSISSYQQSLIDSTHELLLALALVPSIRHHSVEACNKLLGNLRKQYRIYANLSALEVTGDTFCSAEKADPIDPDHCDWFGRVVHTRGFVVNDYTLCRNAKQAMLVCAQPALDESGNLQAVIAATLNLEWLHGLAVKNDLPRGTEIFVIGRNGDILASLSDNKNFVGRSLVGSPVFPLIQTNQQGTIEAYGLDGVRRLFALTSLGTENDTGAYVAVGIPSKLAYAKVDKNLSRNLLTLSAVALIALGAAWFGGDIFVLRKVKKLVGVTERLAAGDLSARTNLTGDGELNLLGGTFDLMAEQLNKREGERRQAEEEIRNSAEKIKLFAYSVSHDLKSPAIGIYGLTKLLNTQYRELLDQRGRNYCEQILRAAEQIAALVEKINVYIATKEDRLQVQAVDLKELLQMVKDEFLVQLNIRRIGWVEPDRLPVLAADRLCLVRIFRNLVDNALKYGGDKLSEIEIGYGETADTHVLSVKDNGVGIKDGDVQKIFGLFQRRNSSPEVEGAGLGLSIVREIAERHGGRAWAEPRPSGGTVFYVSILKDLAESHRCD